MRGEWQGTFLILMMMDNTIQNQNSHNNSNNNANDNQHRLEREMTPAMRAGVHIYCMVSRRVGGRRVRGRRVRGRRMRRVGPGR